MIDPQHPRMLTPIGIPGNHEDPLDRLRLPLVAILTAASDCLAQTHETGRPEARTISERRLHDALEHLNPSPRASAPDDAFRKLAQLEGSTLDARNHTFHRMLMKGGSVEYRSGGGAVGGAQVLGLDLENAVNIDGLDGLAAAPDLQGGIPGAVRL